MTVFCETWRIMSSFWEWSLLEVFFFFYFFFFCARQGNFPAYWKQWHDSVSKRSPVISAAWFQKMSVWLTEESLLPFPDSYFTCAHGNENKEKYVFSIFENASHGYISTPLPPYLFLSLFLLFTPKPPPFPPSSCLLKPIKSSTLKVVSMTDSIHPSPSFFQRCNAFEKPRAPWKNGAWLVPFHQSLRTRRHVTWE